MDHIVEAAAHLTARDEPSEVAITLMRKVFERAEVLRARGVEDVELWRICREELDDIFEISKADANEHVLAIMERWQPNIDGALAILLAPFLQKT